MKCLRSNLSRAVGVASWMTATVAVLAAGLALGGCGNYSNEDLEFLNALPQTDDVSMEAPLQAAVRRADEDDALKTTRKVTTAVNLMAEGALGFVDKIRTFSPSARKQGVRIWGPFPADNNPGWHASFTMTRSLAADGITPHFDYVMVMIDPAGTSFDLLTGWFESKGLVGGGTGQMELKPEAARTDGAVLQNLDNLVDLLIDYDHQSWPHSLDVKVVNEPPAPQSTDAASATYHYERAQNGDGGMTFTFLEDAVTGPLGIDTLDITSRWHGTGEGRSQVSVLAGDGAGTSWTDCWAATSLTSYDSRTSVGDVASCI